LGAPSVRRPVRQLGASKHNQPAVIFSIASTHDFRF